MITCDLHTHTTYSQCGCHSVLEMLQFAINKKMQALAITDHGPCLKPRTPSTFFDRFENPYPDKIRFFKGMECNYTKHKGEIDLPQEYLPHIDVILLGLHLNTPLDLGITHYTDLLLSAVDNNKIHIITHPIDHHFPMDLNEVTQFCSKKNVAMELNNSKIELGLITSNEQKLFIELCMKNNCKMAVNSDAHTVNQLSDDTYIYPILKELNVPKEMIVNHSLESVLNFIKK